nr:hypothetical protein K-LCC10_0298 [Kaumoebavirus]
MLLDDTEMGDVTLKWEGGECKVIGSILKAKSEYFKAMLESQMVEGQTKVVNLGNICVKALREALHYLYVGKCTKTADCVEIHESFLLLHQWNVAEFVAHYADISWTCPHRALDTFLEGYPASEALCISAAKQLLEEYRDRNTEIAADIWYGLNDITSRVILRLLFDRELTPENLREVVEKAS